MSVIPKASTSINRLIQPLSKMKRLRLISITLLSLTFPLYSGGYWLDVGFLAVFYIVLGLGLNIVVGFTGLLDLGYSAFFAVGAYTTGILMTVYDISFWLTIPIGGVIAAMAGIVIGLPTLRLRSDYLAIVTLGFGEIVRISAKNLSFTGGSSGIYGIKSPFPDAIHIGNLTINNLSYSYWAMLVLACIVIIASKRLQNSRLGRSWAYIREDEDAAEAMGVNRVRTKLKAYAIGAVFAGLGGSIFAVKMTAIAPESFSFMQSVLILLAVILGGIGRVSGVVIGAILVIVIPELLRDLDKVINLGIGVDKYRFLIFGIALVMMMVFRPQGLLPVKHNGEK